ncbi:hypothetical protein DFH09DRAFT_1197717 [Mycena vulgaris]|nr:hypothetical protein DFH09DRAFT_1197717 [Mycena vulgaris]
MASHRSLQRQPSFVKRPREELQEIARETLAAVAHGSYATDGSQTYPLIDLSTVPESTEYIPHDAALDTTMAPQTRSSMPTDLVLYHASTLEGVRFCLRTPLSPDETDPDAAPRRPGVLNFASATSPGGGFLWGARAQEETIARSSNLYSALASPAAQPFYAQHDTERAPRYSHAIVYTRDVALVRDDAGTWVRPAAVDVLTSAAVNVRAVRAGMQRQGLLARGDETSLPEEVVEDVQNVMRERMARVLRVFEREGIRDVILGSFGTGAFGNEVEGVARIWAELLVREGALFQNTFRRVVFAIIDRETYGKFRHVFRHMGVGVVEVRE